MKPLVNKAGVHQIDKYGAKLFIGDKVIYMKGNMTKGGRGDIGVGVVVAFDRYAKILTGENIVQDNARVEHLIQTLNSDEYKKDKRTMSEKERSLNLSWSEHEDISPCFLIRVSDQFMNGWIDGSIRE